MHEAHPGRTDPAFEFSKIDDKIYIGTNACCQAHFSEQLLELGVRNDISLEGERLDAPFGVDLYLWLPTPDHAAPERKKTLAGIAALSKVLEQGGRAYIHCKNGHGRAPTFYAAFLVVERGMTVDAAIEHIRKGRPAIHIEPAQKEFLEDLALGH